MQSTPHGQFDIEDFFSVERHMAAIHLLNTLAKLNHLKHIPFPAIWLNTYSYENPHEA